jgi:hypothetical protein
MTNPGPLRFVSTIRPGSLALLFVAATVLGLLSGFPAGLGLLLAPMGVLAAAALRSGSSGVGAAYAPAPVLLVLLLEAGFAPVGFGTELVAGLAGVAFLIWLADDPLRPAGGPRRAYSTIAIPTLALGIAWSSAFFLPAGVVPLGVAGALLAFTLALVAYLVGRPALFDREEEA